MANKRAQFSGYHYNESWTSKTDARHVYFLKSVKIVAAIVYKLAIAEILLIFISHRIHCLVISYDFKGCGRLERSFNSRDKSNLESIFSGHQNKIEFISPAADKVTLHLSAQKISEMYNRCNII
jgi:hypothetical protein